MINEKDYKKSLKKKPMKALYEMAYECIDNIHAWRYQYIITEATRRFIGNEITAQEYRTFNSKVSKKMPNPKNF